jgi:Tol biopolymer transport system component
MHRSFLKVASAAIVVLSLVGALAAQQEKPEVALRAAMETETVKGDLKIAIEQYKKIVAASGENRAVAAQALLRMADCYRKLGDAAAAEHYARIITDFADQKEAVAAAKSRLARSRDPVAADRTVHRSVWGVADGFDLFGKISPDARYVPYTDWNQNGDLFVHDRVKEVNRRLTKDGRPSHAGDEYAEEAAFSRDSRRLAYAWGKDHRYQLRVIDLEGTDIPRPRVLFDNSDVKWIWPEDWTPDGKNIAVGVQRSDGTAQIGLLAADDGTLTVLKSVDWRGYMRMALSPDGRYLAFDLRGAETNTRDVFVLAVDGSREIPVATYSSNEELMGWSPDGRRVVFSSDRTGATGLWCVSFTKGRLAGSPELIRPNAGLFKPMGLTPAGALYTQTWGGWSNGTMVKTAPFDFSRGQFESVPQDVEQSLANATAEPRWSNDGKFIAYTSRPHGTMMGQFSSDIALTVRSLETGEVRELRPKLANFGFVWAPQDDGFFAVGQDFKGRQGIYRVDRKNGSVAPVAFAGPDERLFLPIWSDTSKIHFRRLVQTGVPHVTPPESILVERSLSDGSERELARGLQIGLSVNRRMAYARITTAAGEGSVVEYDVASGTQREVFRHKHLSSFLNVPASPGAFGMSGRFIAVLDEPTTKATVWLSVSLSGTDVREVFRSGPGERLSRFTASPDGSAVFVKKERASHERAIGELWRVPLEAGSPQRIELNGVDLDSILANSFLIHPDGRRVAFVNKTAPRNPYEVWVLENFLPSRE